MYKVTTGLRQANLVLIAYASSEGSGEPAHLRSLGRTSTARSYEQWVKRNLQTESQIPGPFEWLGMRSSNLSWRNAHRHKFAWRVTTINAQVIVTIVFDRLHKAWKVRWLWFYARRSPRVIASKHIRRQGDKSGVITVSLSTGKATSGFRADSIKTVVALAKESSHLLNNGENKVSMLVHSLLIPSSSNLQVMRTGVKS